MLVEAAHLGTYKALNILTSHSVSVARLVTREWLSKTNMVTPIVSISSHFERER